MSRKTLPLALVALIAGALAAFAMIAAAPATASEPASGRGAAAGPGLFAPQAFGNCAPFAGLPTALRLCCESSPMAIGCAAAPAPTPAGLVVRVLNARRQAVRGVQIEVRDSRGVKTRGVTDGPTGELSFRGIAPGRYTVVGRTPPQQTPLALEDRKTVTLVQGRAGDVQLRISAPCGDGSSQAATSFAHGGSRAYASATDDVIRGTPGADLIVDPNGTDVVCGNAGDDRIRMSGLGTVEAFGGLGDDVIRVLRPGMPPRPHTISGGQGDDTLEGSAFADVLEGGSGKDELRGDAGDDTLRGDGGTDRLFGGLGVDALFGGAGDDLLTPGPHADEAGVLGAARPQTADCGSGTDELDRHDIFAPLVADLRSISEAERPSYQMLRARPELVPLAVDCETATLLPPPDTPPPPGTPPPPLPPTPSPCEFLGPSPPAAGQQRTAGAREHQTPEQICAAEKRKRQEAYKALGVGFTVSGAGGVAGAFALNRYKKQAVGTVFIRALRRIGTRQTVALAGGPGVEVAATAISTIDALILTSEVGGVLSVSAEGATGLVALLDPPDPAFRTIPTVRSVVAGRLLRVPRRGLARRLRADLRAHLVSQARLASVYTAFTTALNRAGNAQKAGEPQVMRDQLTAASRFALEIARLQALQPALARRALGPIRPVLRPADWRAFLTPARRRALRARLAARPFDPAAIAVARRAGAPIAQLLPGMRRRARALPTAVLVTDPVTLAMRRASALAAQAPAMRLLAAQLAAG